MTFRFNPYNECYPDKMVSGAMVMDKLPVPRRPTIWMIVGQGPVALPVDAVVWGGGGGGGVWTFLLSSIFSLLFLPLSGRRPDID